jgi:L-ascorbate metabolism protein UlaG (beta-lactamase superfamily)
MKVTYYGHACFGIQIGETNLLIDPFITPNELAEHIDVDSLKPDYILLTHGHEDHVVDVEYIARQSGAKLVSNFEIVSWFGAKGIEGHPMNYGGSWNFEFGKLKYVYAAHSSTLPDGSSGGNAGGFVIESEEGNIYIAGDTSLTMDMKLIPMTNKALDIAILPIGDNFTMDVQDAILASDFIQCNKIIGCHYDTFGYIEIDKESAKKLFSLREKELILLSIGSSLEM